MPNQQKKQKITELDQKSKSAKALFFTDYRGLSVKKMEELRKKLRETATEFEITKNTLLQLALKNQGIELKQPLEGPTATLFPTKDEVIPLQIVINFAKENDNLPLLKSGIIDKREYTTEDLHIIATLPGKEVLLQKIVSTLQSPLQKLVYDLQYHTAGLLSVLENIKKQKESH